MRLSRDTAISNRTAPRSDASGVAPSAVKREQKRPSMSKQPKNGAKKPKNRQLRSNEAGNTSEETDSSEIGFLRLQAFDRGIVASHFDLGDASKSRFRRGTSESLSFRSRYCFVTSRHTTISNRTAPRSDDSGGVPSANFSQNSMSELQSPMSDLVSPSLLSCETKFQKTKSQKAKKRKAKKPT